MDLSQFLPVAGQLVPGGGVSGGGGGGGGRRGRGYGTFSHL